MAELWGYRVGRGGFSSACLPARAPPPAAGPSAPPFPPPPGRGRPATLPRRPVASPSGVRPLFPIARPSPPRPSRLAPRVRGWGGEGVGSASSPRPHPTPRAFRPWRRPRLPPPTKAADPRGADPPVASGGLCGVAGGGSPSRGRLPCPAASRRRPWAGLPRPVAGRPSVCRSGPAAPVARRLASPRLPGLGAFSRPVPHPPRLPRPSVRFSRPVLASPVPLTRVPCPLGAQLPVGAPSLRPRWWCVGGGGGCPGTRVRVGVPPADGLGREDGVRRGRPHRVCEGWRGGGGLCPASRGGDGGGVVVWRRRGPPGPAVGRRAAGHPLRSRAGGAEARVRPRARWGDAAVGGRRRGVGPWGVPCPSPASPFPGT